MDAEGDISGCRGNGGGSDELLSGDYGDLTSNRRDPVQPLVSDRESLVHALDPHVSRPLSGPARAPLCTGPWMVTWSGGVDGHDGIGAETVRGGAR
jgi:hypothetical protein